MLYLTNAFSLNMLPQAPNVNVEVTSISLKQAIDYTFTALYADLFIGAIGHDNTAQLVNEQLGIQVKHSRCSINLHGQDILLVAQYQGPRLPEGAVSLPEGASIKYKLVQFIIL